MILWPTFSVLLRSLIYLKVELFLKAIYMLFIAAKVLLKLICNYFVNHHLSFYDISWFLTESVPFIRTSVIRSFSRIHKNGNLLGKLLVNLWLRTQTLNFITSWSDLHIHIIMMIMIIIVQIWQVPLVSGSINSLFRAVVQYKGLRSPYRR